MNKKNIDAIKNCWEKLLCGSKNFALYTAIPNWI